MGNRLARSELVTLIRMENKHLLSRVLAPTTILVIMFVLNRLAPMIADDFCYAASGVSEVWTTAVSQYFTWNGRFPAHLFGPLFTLAPSGVFDLVNTMVFGVLLGAMTVVARGSRISKPDLAWPPVLAFFLLWFGLPDFGQTALWQMGSANYLWTTTLVVLFLIPFRFLWQGSDIFHRRPALSMAFAVFSIIAGWTNENTAATAWLLAFLAVIAHRQLSGLTPPWAVAALIGHAAGLTLMVMSPGHQVRLASPVFQAWADLSWLTRIVRFTPNAVSSFALSSTIWCVVIVAAFVLFQQRKRLGEPEKSDASVALVLICAAVLNNQVLVLAPMAPRRALTGGGVYLSIAAMILVLSAARVMASRAVVFVAAGGIAVLAVSVAGAVAEYHDLDRKIAHRQSEIETALGEGTTDLVLDPIVFPQSRHMYWGSITDITYQPNHWANSCFARYIGADSVRLVTPVEDGTSIAVGPRRPFPVGEGMTVSEVLYSPEHACLSVILEPAATEFVNGSFLDVRVLSDASPWWRRMIDRLRRRFFPATTTDAFEYPHSRLRKIAVFGSFTIQSVFLEEQALVESDNRLIVFVPLIETAEDIESLYIGRRRAHDATMLLHRIK